MIFPNGKYSADRIKIVASNLTLSTNWVRKLAELPETGAGYQRVRVGLRDGRELRSVIVLNAEIMVLPKDAGTITENDIQDINIES
jgi:hypothetical protein